MASGIEPAGPYSPPLTGKPGPCPIAVNCPVAFRRDECSIIFRCLDWGGKAFRAQPMQLKTPRFFFVESRKRPVFSLENLLSGESGVVTSSDWVVLAPHVGQEVIVDLGDLAVLEAMQMDGEYARDKLASRFGAVRIDRLVMAGLLIGDHPAHDHIRNNDRVLRETGWWGPAAVVQAFGRWDGVDVAGGQAREGRRTLKTIIDEHGAPPSEVFQVRPQETWRPLPPPGRSSLDDLLHARSTCRNFNADESLPLADVGTLMHRVFAAQAAQAYAPGAVALKKNSPSGGGLHPIEAYLLIQRVDGLEPGIYHYHCTSHHLEPMQRMATSQATQMAYQLVAGQQWFADAPVHVLLAARFQRNFWKYRSHAKALRAIYLDAGHLSQNLYLTATELGYGAFITAAINDGSAERFFELDGLGIGAIAVCGFGRRAAETMTTELDPLGKAVR